MAPNTSPSICNLFGDAGIAFQDNENNLVLAGKGFADTNDAGNTGYKMKPGTSPSICATGLSFDPWRVAFQSDKGILWVVGRNKFVQNTFGPNNQPLPMMGGTSPSIIFMP